MNTYYRMMFIFAFGALEMFAIMNACALTAHAETRTGGLISQDEVWTREAGPYLLTENLTVLGGAHLTVEAGTKIGVAPEAQAEFPEDGPGIFVSGGQISLAGSRSDRIEVRGISGLFITADSFANGAADITESDFVGGSRVSFDNSRGTISTSTITGTDMGLYFKDSIVSIWGSRIENNDIGIYVQPHQVFQLGMGSSPYGMGGVGNALQNASDLYTSSSLSIAGSSLAGNSSYSISNGADISVAAAGNWWGTGAGPAMQGGNSIRGKAAYSPWLSTEPAFDSGAQPAACCSSILFIPGLEGTRLYSGSNQLWEPNRNADVAKLVLSSAGSSTNSAIYSGEPIGKALGFVGIYDRFMKSLDSLVSGGYINEWRAFGYDWRKPVADVVGGSEKKATTTESLLDVVGRLASTSRTGKVSIIAHSNGGLVAKYLVKTLADQGRAGLIDSVISVAVPYLGTPEAIDGLLHGDGQKILGGLILNSATARSMGANMPSAYSLLPSAGFFSKVFAPTIVFASTTVPDLNNGSYPEEIRSAQDQSAFIADTAHARKAPAASDVKPPLKGNQLLINAAYALHAVLDPFEWPSAIARWAIVGWNVDTTQHVDYSSSNRHEDIKSPYGDGIVVPQSASYNDGKVLSVDLKQQSALDGRDLSHSTILESSTTESAIRSIITDGADPNVLNDVAKLPGVMIGEPDWNDLNAAYDASRKELRVSTHSPVELHIYDSHGNHTGLIPLPPEAAGQAEDGLYSMKEDGIPGSFSDIPECTDPNDCDTSITLPDNGEAYTVVVDGAGTGAFTLDIERIRASSTTETVEWSNIPTSPLASATTTIASGGSSDAPHASLASSTAPLRIDMDGDGITDATASPDTALGNGRFLDLFKKACGAFGRLARCDAFAQRIDRLKARIGSLRFREGKGFHGYAIATRFRHLGLRRFSDPDALAVLSDMDSFLSQFDR